MGIGWSLRASGSRSDRKLEITPSEIEGPFYPRVKRKDKDFDLTRIEGRSGVAKGKHIIVEVQITDIEGNGIEDALVDLWQAAASGKYNHPRDPNPAESDPDFQGWALAVTGSEGKLRFKTVMPGAYPAAPGWQRPPHIHFKVSSAGYESLTTQMYFAGQPLNNLDHLLRRKRKEDQVRMIASRLADNPQTFLHQLVLQQLVS
ncbi:MAG: hypothetical protein KUG71_02390 [Porticoccaceae bacterium]|nr:hypothetical protein [Porticoccaceae bacterium]